MNNEFNKIIKAVQSVNLSENEKDAIKANIISGVFIAQSSNVINSTPSRLYYMSGVKNYFNLLINQNNYMSALIIAIMLALGGTSVVAENSVPGEALHTVKTSFNEPVAGLFAVGKESNAVWQERIIERRLEEIQKIVSEGNLSTTTKAEIETNINNQIKKFDEMSKKLSEDNDKVIDSAELAVRLESALKAHQSILQRVSNLQTSTSTKETTKELISLLKKLEKDIKNDREKLELVLGDGLAVASSTATSTQVTPIAVTNKQNVAQKILDNVKTKYQEEKNNLASSTISKIDAELLNVEKVLAEGKAYVVSREYDLAFSKFQEVIRLANQARVTILTGSIKVNIEDDMDMEHRDDDEDDDEDDDKYLKSKNKNATSTDDDNGDDEDDDADDNND